jgi:hypothetical protein
MQFDTTQIFAALAIGIGATLAMDVWNLFLKRVFRVPSLDYCLLGRWVRHMPSAFRHESIAAAAPKRRECSVGWIAHYSIGISMALAFVLLTQGKWLADPTLLPALLYGIGTIVFPFFIMQPALGLGIASSQAPKPMQARLKSFGTHTVYGGGLYIWALVLSV